MITITFLCMFVVAAGASSEMRCTGEDNGCCTAATPCGLGEGDCDNSNECKKGLICGKDNCPWGDDDDCCIAIRTPPPVTSEFRCNGGNGCCTAATPCGIGQGDCDNNKECKGNLICGKFNCDWDGDDDCCTVDPSLPPEKRCFRKTKGGECCEFPFTYKGKEYNDCIDINNDTPWCGTKNYDEKKNPNNWGNCAKEMRCTGEDNGCCTAATPCGLGEGDCDNSNECKKGLICGKDNCPWGDDDDCCIADPALQPVTLGCSRKTKGGECCVFPFTYKGKEYNDCIDINNDTPWCGTKDYDYKHDINKHNWGNCDEMRCTGEDNGCCTAATPCGLGQGDCDNDNECAKGLVCGKDNCPWGDDDDCCIRG